ncbi:unnamed protein product, partial [Schistosoma curassoni]|uniref:Uncharacterized protein n=1 Tax=Schistosoma curassoni TaxID=6186 RepID=A0A183JM83_9TREM
NRLINISVDIDDVSVVDDEIGICVLVVIAVVVVVVVVVVELLTVIVEYGGGEGLDIESSNS